MCTHKDTQRHTQEMHTETHMSREMRIEGQTEKERGMGYSQSGDL